MNLTSKKIKKINSIYSFVDDYNSDLVLTEVQKFYKNSPFPSYQENETLADILDKGDSNLIAKQIKSFLMSKKFIVLEAGSGTCQLSSYLAIGSNNIIIAYDGTLESLQEGEKFKLKFGLNNLEFFHGNILNEDFNEEVFDFIWCSGVLHHTHNAYLGFKNLVKILKRDSYIVLGLYNRYGRLRTLIRNLFSKIFIFKSLRIFFLKNFDPILRKLYKNPDSNKDKINAWLRDQYFHPHETLYSFDEVIGWFKKNNIEYISSIPDANLGNNSLQNIFNKRKLPCLVQRLYMQFKMIFTNYGSEGGLFLIIGRKI